MLNITFFGWQGFKIHSLTLWHVDYLWRNGTIEWCRWIWGAKLLYYVITSILTRNMCGTKIIIYLKMSHSICRKWKRTHTLTHTLTNTNTNTNKKFNAITWKLIRKQHRLVYGKSICMGITKFSKCDAHLSAFDAFHFTRSPKIQTQLIELIQTQ